MEMQMSTEEAKSSATEQTPDETLYDEEKSEEEVKADAEEAPGEDEPDETSEEEPNPSDEDDQEEGDEETLSSLEDFDFDGRDVNELTMNVKVDGEVTPVKVGELVSKYRIDAAGEKRLTEANALKDQAKAQLEVQQQQWQASMEMLPTVVKVSAQEMHLGWLRQQLDSSDLRKDNPAEYMARKGELDEALANVQQSKAEIRQKAQENQSGMSEKQKAETDQWIASETEKLIEIKPELADKKAWKEWTSELVKFAESKGFTKEDVEGVQDHRMLLLLNDAMQFHKGKVTAAAKKKAKPQRTVKSGARSEPKQQPKDAAEILYG